MAKPPPAATARSRAGRSAAHGEGERQAAALRPRLAGQAFDSVWASDLDRAVNTARLAWGEPRQDARLREMSFGALGGPRVGGARPERAGRPRALLGLHGPGRRVVRGAAGAGAVARRFARPGPAPALHPRGCRAAALARGGCRQLRATGTLLVLDWEARRIVSRTDEAGEAAADCRDRGERASEEERWIGGDSWGVAGWPAPRRSRGWRSRGGRAARGARLRARRGDGRRPAAADGRGRAERRADHRGLPRAHRARSTGSGPGAAQRDRDEPGRRSRSPRRSTRSARRRARAGRSTASRCCSRTTSTPPTG